MNFRHSAVRRKRLLLSIISLLAVTPAYADAGEYGIPLATVWTAVCAALVFLMQAGFALLESGSTRAKNAINVIMKNYTDVCFGIVIYWLIGYGLMFGDKSYGLIGTSTFAPTGLSNDLYIGLLYQMMFAATAATIISGAVAERMRYWPYVLGAVFVTGLIYPISGSWIWGGSDVGGYGWLEKLGFIDLAGSTVVHSVGGWCALAAIIVLGPRTGRFSLDHKTRDIPGHNLPMVSLGGFILWFGWFGFNGGSSAGSSDDVGLILLNTQVCAATGVIGALSYMTLRRQPILMTNTVNGALGGLVASCAGAATMEPGFALITGFVAGWIVVIGTNLLREFHLDDVVSAIPVHAFCGAWGTLAAGLFYADDMFNVKIVLVQLVGIAAVCLWSFFASLLIYGCINAMIGMRASKLHEQRGLDYTEHYEIGYAEFQDLVLHQGKQTDI